MSLYAVVTMFFDKQNILNGLYISQDFTKDVNSLSKATVKAHNKNLDLYYGGDVIIFKSNGECLNCQIDEVLKWKRKNITLITREKQNTTCAKTN